MNLVDSSGWLEYLTNGPHAGLFGKPIEDIKHLIVPSVCIYEVFKKALQLFDEKKALEAAVVMRMGKVVPLDDQMAFAAAALSHKLKFPMADSIILATGRQYQAIIWTQDADFQNMPGVKYIAKRS
ncbi:MAG: type II toxin-antitoxin system VapC family toxin [Candidatus Omnitrophica bacterium]|nr:type II toxin-antitoxin system VapC family toxin [Candidatus Omnitrophota bacterium]